MIGFRKRLIRPPIKSYSGDIHIDTKASRLQCILMESGGMTRTVSCLPRRKRQCFTTGRRRTNGKFSFYPILPFFFPFGKSWVSFPCWQPPHHQSMGFRLTNIAFICYLEGGGFFLFFPRILSNRSLAVSTSTSTKAIRLEGTATQK